MSYNNDPTYNRRSPRPVNGLSIAALILGILSVVFSVSAVGGLILGILSIIFAFASRQKQPMLLTAKLGLIFSSIGVVFSGLLLALYIFFGIPALHNVEKKIYREVIPYTEHGNNSQDRSYGSGNSDEENPFIYTIPYGSDGSGDSDGSDSSDDSQPYIFTIPFGDDGQMPDVPSTESPSDKLKQL